MRATIIGGQDSPNGDPGAGGGRRRLIAWSSIPFVLVVATLLGSVVVPAVQTARILHSLRQESDVIEPARRLETGLQLSVWAAANALREFESGDEARTTGYAAAIADADRRLENCAACRST